MFFKNSIPPPFPFCFLILQTHIYYLLSNSQIMSGSFNFLIPLCLISMWLSMSFIHQNSILQRKHSSSGYFILLRWHSMSFICSKFCKFPFHDHFPEQMLSYFFLFHLRLQFLFLFIMFSLNVFFQSNIEKKIFGTQVHLIAGRFFLDSVSFLTSASCSSCCCKLMIETKHF